MNTIIKHELKACQDLATQDNIFDRFDEQIAGFGYAGSTDIPRLVYLAMLSAMNERPVSLLIKGPSGAGKSFSLKMGKQFIPTDRYVEYSGMSEKALVYLKDVSFKHKHLIIGEAAGMATGDGRTLLRQFLSEDSVRYVTVQKSDKGMYGAELPSIEGPCGLIMTTTASNIHLEDENRMIAVSMHESEEQIRKALLAQALGSTRTQKVPDYAPWFALYELIDSGTKEVSIPFAADIAKELPLSHDKVKRDFPQILSLIKASALLHSCTRDRTAEGAVIAQVEDYRVVYELVNKAVSEGLAKSVPEALRRLVETVAATSGSDSVFGISVSALADVMKRDISVVSRTAKQAVEQGYLENNNPGQGKEARLVLGGRKLPNSSALPSPEKLFDAPKTPKPSHTIEW